MTLNFKEWLRKYPMVLTTNVIGAGFWIAIVSIAWQQPRGYREASTNVLLCLFGTTVGWWLGYIGAPFTPTEKKHFNQLAKPVTLFLSGYLFSKLDQILAQALLPQWALSHRAGPRLLYVASTALIAAMLVFSNRLARLNSTDVSAVE